MDGVKGIGMVVDSMIEHINEVIGSDFLKISQMEDAEIPLFIFQTNLFGAHIYSGDEFFRMDMRLHSLLLEDHYYASEHKVFPRLGILPPL